MGNVIHPQYTLKNVLYSAAGRFERGKSIQLHQFLLPEAFAKASRALLAAPVSESYLPDRYRGHAPKKIPSSVSGLLRWLKSKEAAELVSLIVDKRVRCASIGIAVLTHGDYTLLHDKNKESPGFDVILDLTPQWDNRACGYHSYVDGDSNELVRVDPAPNTLTIVHRPKNVMKFVKYVNHFASKDKRIVLQARFA